ncbi:MAG: hypothetical protein KDA45_08075 [Planctomycetales bacterium]|nr:hypothetical protein [Planctomycetales bacterium]
MPFSDEDLIAYLLGDASDELSQQIQRHLTLDADLLERLAQLYDVLKQIDSLNCTYEPPANLVDSTLARLEQVPTPADNEAEPQTDLPQPATASGFSMVSGIPPRRNSLWDSTALATSLTILCCLALPALVRARFESRKAQCAHNLRTTGGQLFDYALNSPEQRFPLVAIAGPESFAGVYAVHLQDAGATISPGQLNCASLRGAERPSSALDLQAIPTISQLHRLALEELELWQRVIGGDFAYNLGVEERGLVRAPKCDGRSHFAILADAPIVAGNEEQLLAHDGRGLNIYYGDGRVVFVAAQFFLQAPAAKTTESSLAASPVLRDNPFQNQLGAHEVGLHPQDASLAPSHFPPLGAPHNGAFTSPR